MRRKPRICECGGKVPWRERSPFRGHRKGCAIKARLVNDGYITAEFGRDGHLLEEYGYNIRLLGGWKGANS